MKLRVLASVMVGVMTLSATSFAAATPLTGTVNSAKWIGTDSMVVRVETSEGTTYEKLNLNGSHELLLTAAANATELTTSKDGTKAAYVNDNGDLFLLDLVSKKESKISVDVEAKLELQFNEAGTKLYFLMGEKIDKIAVINLADGKQSVLVSDGVAYKSDLNISKDETKAVYIVTSAGKVDETNDSYAVDTKGTEPQLYSAKLGSTDKPVKLTDTLDNKVSTSVTATGEILYVSASEKADNLPLKRISADGRSNLFYVNHMDVESVVVLSDGNILLRAFSAGKEALFVADSAGITKKLVELPEGTTEVAAADLTRIVITMATAEGEKLAVYKQGKFVDLTK